jgi:hypothetical protein
MRAADITSCCLEQWHAVSLRAGRRGRIDLPRAMEPNFGSSAPSLWRQALTECE